MGVTLSELKVGDKGKIIGFKDIDRTFRSKLLSMGLVKGCEFTIKRVAPLGDPMEIHIRDFNLTLRKDEVNAVVVERI